MFNSIKRWPSVFRNPLSTALKFVAALVVIPVALTFAPTQAQAAPAKKKGPAKPNKRHEALWKEYQEEVRKINVDLEKGLAEIYKDVENGATEEKTKNCEKRGEIRASKTRAGKEPEKKLFAPQKTAAWKENKTAQPAQEYIEAASAELNAEKAKAYLDRRFPGHVPKGQCVKAVMGALREAGVENFKRTYVKVDHKAPDFEFKTLDVVRLDGIPGRKRGKRGGGHWALCFIENGKKIFRADFFHRPGDVYTGAYRKHNVGYQVYRHAPSEMLAYKAAPNEEEKRLTQAEAKFEAAGEELTRKENRTQRRIKKKLAQKAGFNHLNRG